ncbi:subunit of tubulin prefoldin [Suhomyces tanzawaensis NRRL Y-17324]|uniref:Subunit of tubulin prefoldin n=1 Tax=Suhomyces tanzawaensis NRRL Y-17324 TaxID=984487 RepID=A0A1E4SPI2_9ASCO|nr:subunit of tubulin prefoldin [Suhomyces tanzawaensis NRRL Y-17324]ODV81405.1 subunit of tubulin prefoldin [Suhomyces tanzawaensis NRRL Y-17324]
MAAPQQQIDLTKLQPQQLVEVRKQIDQEIQHFTQSLQALQTAQAKLRDCVASIDNLEKSQDGTGSKDLLVPLTSSLYLPGQVVKKNEYLVDIGTGYFVEKNAPDAKKVYDVKIVKLSEDGAKLKDILMSKNEMLNRVNMVLRDKMVEYEAQQKN